jgi:hypothetical protein
VLPLKIENASKPYVIGAGVWIPFASPTDDLAGAILIRAQKGSAALNLLWCVWLLKDQNFRLGPSD